jgi:hypothetical protein
LEQLYLHASGAVVRALLCRPKILMLDEPANPLNSLPEDFIRDALNWLRRHYTMLMIAQPLSTVRPGALDHSGAERRPVTEQASRRNPWRPAAF